MNRTVTRAGSVIAAAGLVLASVAIASPAHAATFYVDAITPGAESEATYFGWHEGYADVTHTFDADGLHFGADGASQILNGLVGGGEQGLTTTSADLLALITGSTTTLVSGQATFQVAVTASDPTEGNWATLRPAALFGAGEYTPTATELWQLSRAVGGITTDAQPLGELLDALEEAGNQLRYSGFGVWAGEATVLESITWGADIHLFTPEPAAEPAPAAEIPPTGSDLGAPLAIGALVLLAGVGIVLFARFRRSANDA